jgi:hypothetical protein
MPNEPSRIAPEECRTASPGNHLIRKEREKEKNGGSAISGFDLVALGDCSVHLTVRGSEVTLAFAAVDVDSVTLSGPTPGSCQVNLRSGDAGYARCQQCG